jgi:hypothetical protein
MEDPMYRLLLAVLVLTACDNPTAPPSGEERVVTGHGSALQTDGSRRYFLTSGSPPDQYLCWVSAEEYAEGRASMPFPFACEWEADNDPYS